MQNLNQSRLVTGVFPRFRQIACFSSSFGSWVIDPWSKCALSQSSVRKNLITWPAYPGCLTSRWGWLRLITQEAKHARFPLVRKLRFINPCTLLDTFAPRCDQQVNSPYNITFFSCRKVMRKKNNIKPRDMNWSNTRFCLLVSKEMLARQRRKRYRNCSVSVITFFSSHLNIVWLHQSSPLPRSSSLTERSWVKWAACSC